MQRALINGSNAPCHSCYNAPHGCAANLGAVRVKSLEEHSIWQHLGASSNHGQALYNSLSLQRPGLG